MISSAGLLCCARRRGLRLLTATVIPATVAFGLAGGTAQADSCATSATLEAMRTTQSACWHPFTSSSPINTQLPDNPKLADNNAALQQHMASYHWTLQGSNSGFSFTANGTRPVYFASPSDPTMTVHCTNEEGPNTCMGYNGIDVNNATIHVPASAQPGNNWDAHMIVVQSDTGQEYDFWHASISGHTLTAGTGSVTNVTTTDGTRDSGDAGSLALTAGLLRPSELASGQIDHALVVDVPCTNSHGATTGFVWPAAGGWGETCGDYWSENATGAPNIGQLLHLNLTDTQIANSAAPTWQKTIMTALAHYGAYVEDTNGSWHDEGIYIFSQDPTSWTSLGQANPWTTVIHNLGGTGNTLNSTIPIPVNNLTAIDPCVPHGTCTNAAGPTATTTHLALARIAKSPTRSHATRASRHRRAVARSGRRHQRRGAHAVGTRRHRHPRLTARRSHRHPRSTARRRHRRSTRRR